MLHGLFKRDQNTFFVKTMQPAFNPKYSNWIDFIIMYFNLKPKLSTFFNNWYSIRETIFMQLLVELT